MSRYTAVHSNPRGPGDARPTARQIVEDEGLLGKLTGKTAFVTGANQGVGLETAGALWATGATVFLAVRDLKKGRRAVEDLKAKDPTNKAPLHVIELCLDSLSSVRSAAKTFLAESNQLNLLILNAGVMATPEGKTVDGFETQFAINYLGHFLLFQLLKPALLAASTPPFHSRVISVSSLAHRISGIRFHDIHFEDKGSYDPMLAYGQSKTASFYLAIEIERRYGASGLHGISVHPGVVATNLVQYLDPDVLKNMMDEKVEQSLKSPAQGASTTVYAAISKEWEGRGGKYLVDCVEEGPADPDAPPSADAPGYAPWAFDESKASRLWTESCKMVDVEDDV